MTSGEKGRPFIPANGRMCLTGRKWSRLWFIIVSRLSFDLDFTSQIVFSFHRRDCYFLLMATTALIGWRSLLSRLLLLLLFRLARCLG